MSDIVAGSRVGGDEGPRRSLILAGGGMRVAYQAGVLQALIESGLTFDHADGTSGGIINLAMLFSGLTPQEMCERWRTLHVKDFMSLMPLSEYLKGPHVEALSDADGIVRDVFPHLGIDPDAIRRATGMLGTFNVCDFVEKTNRAFEHSEIVTEILVAGISLPLVMPAIHLDGATYIDAVWIRDANLPEAVRRGAEEIWLVWCIGNTPVYRPGLLRQYVHMIEMSANGSLFEDIERIGDLNRRIDAGEVVDGRTRPIRLHVIRPEVALPLDPDFFAGRIDAEGLIAMGYRDASRYVSDMRQEGVPLDTRATKMRDAGDSLLYREVFTGAFSLGATDPVQGAADTEHRGELSLIATVEIDGLDRFIKDAQHRGSLTGRLSFDPIGRNLMATDGSFNLVHANDRARRMTYEGTFRHGDRRICLVGAKELRDDRGFDAWSDLTTMLAVLHEGPDASGPVIGAGVLHQDRASLRAMLSNLHATNVDSIAGRAASIQRFARFFAGELWDAYT